MRYWISMAAVGMALVAAPVAMGGQASGSDVAAARKALYKEVGVAFKTVNDELRKPAPDVAVLVAPARTVAAHLKRFPGMYPAGSQGGRAKPEVWTDFANFRTLNAAAVTEADKLASVVGGKDVAAIRTQVMALGKTCQTCHKQFRGE